METSIVTTFGFQGETYTVDGIVITDGSVIAGEVVRVLDASGAVIVDFTVGEIEEMDEDFEAAAIEALIEARP